MPRCVITALLLAALVPPATAQMRGGFGFGGFHNGGFGGHFGRGFGRSLVFFGDPFLDTDYVPTPYQTSSPPIVIIQPNTAAASPAEPKAEPLLIEWQGNRYVRYSGQHESPSGVSLDYSESRELPALGMAAALSSTPATNSRPDLRPAVLVYRDGHHEEVSDYVITSGTLYARGDYYRDGFWTKTVQLSALDIPATVHANADSGVKFVLPSAPNEVVTRP
jgi:hypothetical protein